MLLGIIMCTIANIGINLGTNIIKLAFNRRQNKVEELIELEKVAAVGQELPENGVKEGDGRRHSSIVVNPISDVMQDLKDFSTSSQIAPIYKWRSWQLGFAIFKTSNVINFVSLGFGKQSILASLSSVQFVSNLVFCYFVLHERLGLNDVMGTTAIIMGVILCIVANSTGDNDVVYTVDDLIQLMQHKSYLIYLAVICIFGVLAWMTFTGNFVIFKLDVGGAQKEKNGNGETSGAGERDSQDSKNKGVKYYSGNNLSPMKDRDFVVEAPKLFGLVKIETIRPLCFAMFSAVIGTQVVTLAKITMLQIRLSVDGEQQFDKALTYVFIVGMIFTGIFWDKQINLGLKKFDALVIVPVMQSFWTIFAICNGGMFFQEFQQLSTTRVLIFCSGMVVMLFGMSLLMWQEEEIFEDELVVDEFLTKHKDSVEGGQRDSRASIESYLEDENLKANIKLKEGTGKKLLRRKSASIVLYKETLEESMAGKKAWKKTNSERYTNNPILEEGEEGKGEEEEPRLSVSKTVKTVKRRSILENVISGRRGTTGQGAGKKSIGRVRSLSAATSSATFGFGIFSQAPTLESIDELN